MKRINSLIIILSLVISILTGCSPKVENTQHEGELGSTSEKVEQKSVGNKIKIGIVQPVEHLSLNEIREYIILGLEELGLKDKVEITYKDGQGDASNINTIVSQYVGDKMDVIVPIATGAAQSAAAATKDIPIVFAAVSYPIEAGLVEQLDKTEKNITGVSDAIGVDEILDLALKLTPNIKTFGFVYNSSEVNSVAAIEKAKEYCDMKGLKYAEATITNSGDLLQASQSLVSKVDAIFTPTDNTVASAMPVLSAEAIKAKIPVYVGADSMVADGGFATVGVDYKILGRQVAAMIKRIIDGEKISDNPVEVLNKYTKIINITTAKEIGIEIPKESLKDFQIVE